MCTTIFFFSGFLIWMSQKAWLTNDATNLILLISCGNMYYRQPPYQFMSLLCGSLSPSKFISHSRMTIYSCLPPTYKYHSLWGYVDRTKKSRGPYTYLVKLMTSLLSIKPVHAEAACWDIPKPTNKCATC